MMSLRRRYARVRRRARFQRFHAAVLLTIVVLAYAAVPPVARVVSSMTGGYSPGHYEPKDSEREAWMTRIEEGPDAFLAHIPWGTVINVLLFLLVAVVWLTLVPTRATRRPPPH
jgi:hypothetical protein